MVLVHLGTCLPRNLSTRPFVYPGTCPPRNLKLSCLEQIDRLQNVHTQRHTGTRTKTLSTAFQDQKAVKMATSCLEVFLRYGSTVVLQWPCGLTVPRGHQRGRLGSARRTPSCQEWRHCPDGVGCPSCSKGGRWPPPSSCPMCLAKSVPSFFTSLPASTCQPPSDALSPTLLFCPVHFSVKGMVLSVIGCVGRYWHGGSLEGRYYGSVVISPRLQRHICYWQQRCRPGKCF